MRRPSRWLFHVEPATPPSAREREREWPSAAELASLPPIDEIDAAMDFVPDVPDVGSLPMPAKTRPDQWHSFAGELRGSMPSLLAMRPRMNPGSDLVGIAISVYRRLRKLQKSLQDWPAVRPIRDAHAVCAELGLPMRLNLSAGHVVWSGILDEPRSVALTRPCS